MRNQDTTGEETQKSEFKMMHGIFLETSLHTPRVRHQKIKLKTPGKKLKGKTEISAVL